MIIVMNKRFVAPVSAVVVFFALIVLTMSTHAKEVVIDFSEMEVLKGEWELTDEGLRSKTAEGEAVATIELAQDPTRHVYTYEWTVTFHESDMDEEELFKAELGFLQEEKGYPSKPDVVLFPYYGLWLGSDMVAILKSNYWNFWTTAGRDEEFIAERGKTYNLKLVVNNRRDGNYTLHINGEEIISWWEPHPHDTMGKYITLRTYNAEVTYSEIKVSW